MATLQLIRAHGAEHVPRIQALFREYAANTGLDLCFQNFNAELAELPGKYAPPDGRLLLVTRDDQDAGCVALRPFAASVCEMKRLYVRPAFRGQGIGRLLASAIIEVARGIGYRSMKLDTLATMREAIALYHSLGFQNIPSYYHNPLPNVVYLELNLS